MLTFKRLSGKFLAMCGGALAFVALAAGVALITNVSVDRAERAQAAPQTVPVQQSATTKPVMVIYKTTDQYHALDTTNGQGLQLPAGSLISSTNLLGTVAPAIDNNGNLYGFTSTSVRVPASGTTDGYRQYKSHLRSLAPNETSVTEIGSSDIGRSSSSRIYPFRGTAFVGDVLYAIFGSYLYTINVDTGDATRICSHGLGNTNSGQSYPQFLVGLGDTLYVTKVNTDSLHTLAAPADVGTGYNRCTKTDIGTPDNNWGGQLQHPV